MARQVGNVSRQQPSESLTSAGTLLPSSLMRLLSTGHMGLLMSLLNDTAAGFPQHKEHEDASYTLDGTYRYSCRIPSGITHTRPGSGSEGTSWGCEDQELGASEAILDTGYLGLACPHCHCVLRVLGPD